MPKHSQGVATTHMGKLIKPEGKANKAQSFIRKIFELPTGSPANFSYKILYLLCLLWAVYSF